MIVHASTPQIVRCGLLCVACNMPASKKTSWFKFSVILLNWAVQGV